jgi:hypothetical protein
MPASITANGQSLAALSFYVSRAPGFVWDGPSIAAPGVDLIDRSAALFAGPRRFAARDGKLIGTIDPAARTVAAAWTAAVILKDLLYSGEIELRFTDTAGNVVTALATCTSVAVSERQNVEHFQSPTVLDVDASFSITSYNVDGGWTERALAVAATPYDIPLGTMASGWIASIMGVANNPVLTARAPGGAVLWTLTFTKNLDTTAKWLELDAIAGKIWLHEGAVVTPGESLLTGGNTDWPRPFDPQDGDYATSQWMTLEVTPGTGVVRWFKRYL